MKKLLCIVAIGWLAGCASPDKRIAPDAGIALVETMAQGRSPHPELTSQERAHVEQHPLGSAENPVRAAGPSGQRAYLYRLRCPEGRAPTFNRRGAASVLSPYGSISDIYEAACNAPPLHLIYIDMYHPGHEETKSVEGFSIVAPGPDSR